MSISECRLITLPKITTSRGNLTFVEENNQIPFEIKRMYYCYDTPQGIDRGGHAHKNLHQLIIAISGSFDVLLDDGFKRTSFHLDKPNLGLYVPPMIWHELNNFTPGAICLVIVSELFTKEVTVNSYETYRKMVGD